MSFLPTHGRPDAEVAIVGGGPAGSSTALFLLKHLPSLRGRVHLYEKHRHPREKLCGGALSAWGIDHLRALGLGDDVHGVAIDAFAVRLEDNVHRVRHPGLARVVRRSVFDAMLFEAAIDRGAVAHESSQVTGLCRTANGWSLTATDGSLGARIVVGADGTSGGMRKLLGLAEARPRAQLTVVETTGSEPRDSVSDGTLVFDLTPLTLGIQGYYWDFPSPLDGTPGTSRGIFDLHAAHRSTPGGARTVLDKALLSRSVTASVHPHRAWSIRPYAPGSRVSVPGALLVGEAVGVDPLTGEGIAHALEYGRMAASAVARALSTGDMGFGRWSGRIAESFIGHHLRDANRIAARVYGPRGLRHARALLSSPTLLRRAIDWYAGGALGVGDLGMFAGVLLRNMARGVIS